MSTHSKDFVSGLNAPNKIVGLFTLSDFDFGQNGLESGTGRLSDTVNGETVHLKK